MKILLAYPAHTRAVDGIRDYATQLVDQLGRDGDDAMLVRPHRRCTLGLSLIRALPRRGEMVLIVQYNPFAWGRWGIAPSLPLALALVRLRRSRVRVMMAVHEAYVPVKDLRSLLMSAWQRAQLRILLALSHGAVAMTEQLAHDLSRGWPSRCVKHVPVGSNLPDERAARHAARVAGGYEERLVIATFTSGHETHLHGHVVRAAEAVVRVSPRPVVLLLLGTKNVLPSEVPALERTVAPGYLDDRSLASALSTADVFLAPFADGATTRRTTLMAALQHGIATITTRSDRTDAVLTATEALAFAEPNDAEGFAAQSVRLAANAMARKEQALAARVLYDSHFSWPVVCAGLRSAINELSKTAR